MPGGAAGGCCLLGVSAACCSSSLSSPTLTSKVCSLRLRHTVTLTALSIGVSATMRGRRRMSVTSLPSKVRTTSPGWMPAACGRAAFA